MARKFVIIKDGNGQLVARPLAKPQTPRNLRAWLSAARWTSLQWGARFFVFRYGGQYHVCSVGPTEPIKSFDSLPAAEMFLIHCCGRSQ